MAQPSPKKQLPKYELDRLKRQFADSLSLSEYTGELKSLAKSYDLSPIIEDDFYKSLLSTSKQIQPTSFESIKDITGKKYSIPIYPTPTFDPGKQYNSPLSPVSVMGKNVGADERNRMLSGGLNGLLDLRGRDDNTYDKVTNQGAKALRFPGGGPVKPSVSGKFQTGGPYNKTNTVYDNSKGDYNPNDIFTVLKQIEGANEGYNWLTDWYKKRGTLSKFKDLSASALQQLTTPPGLNVSNTPEYLFGSYSSNTGDMTLSKNQRDPNTGGIKQGVALHELNHRVQDSNKIYDHIQQIKKYTIPQSQVDPQDREFTKYLTDPIEFHSFMMNLRNSYNIDPTKTFTEKDLDRILEESRTTKDQSKKDDLLKLINAVDDGSGDKFIKLMNSVVSTDKKSVPTAQMGGNIPFNPIMNPLNSLFGGKQSLNDTTLTPQEQQVKDSVDNIGVQAEVLNRLRYSKSPQIEHKYFQDSDPSIQLTEGHLRGAKLQKGIVDSIKESAKKYKIDPWDMLAVAAKESTFGYGPFGGERRGNSDDFHEKTPFKNAISSQQLFTYNDAITPGGIKGTPISFEEFAYNKGNKNVSYTQDKFGTHFTPVDGKEGDLYQNTDLKDKYKKYISDFKAPTGKIDIFDLVAKRIKEKGIGNLNPGDKDYAKRVEEYKQMLQNNKYPIKFALGGHINSTGYTPGYDTMNNAFNIIPGKHITANPMDSNTVLSVSPIYSTGLGESFTYKKGMKDVFDKRAIGFLERKIQSFKSGGKIEGIHEVESIHKEEIAYLNSIGYNVEVIG
jgi:hypothetical protein